MTLRLGKRPNKHVLAWAIVLILTPYPAAATIRYVDQNHARCTDGISRDRDRPYCTTTAAFRDLQTGDTIRIRDSMTPYKLSILSTVQGPITIEAAPGHHPVFTTRGSQTMLTLLNTSHWTIQGLTFDGAGQEVKHAIVVDASVSDVTNVRIQHNRFVNLGGNHGQFKKPMAVKLTNSKWKKRTPDVHAYSVSNSSVSNNVFDNCAHGGIALKHTKNITLANNRMVNFRCGRYRDGRIGVQAVKIEFSSLDTEVRGNHIGHFQPSSQCSWQPGRNPKTGKVGRSKYVAIYCDVGPHRGLVADNVIFDIDSGRSASAPNHQGSAIGIFIESRCADWKIRNNLIYNIGRHAFRNGSRSTGYADRTEFSHNTVYNIAGDALSIRQGEELRITHNIIANYGGVAIDFLNYSHCQKAGKKCRLTDQTKAFHQTSHQIDNNLFWTEQGSKPVARWFQHKTKLDLDSWRTMTGGYDRQSTYAEPKFVDIATGNFALQSSMRSRLKTPEGFLKLGYRQNNKN